MSNLSSFNETLIFPHTNLKLSFFPQVGGSPGDSCAAVMARVTWNYWTNPLRLIHFEALEMLPIAVTLKILILFVKKVPLTAASKTLKLSMQWNLTVHRGILMHMWNVKSSHKQKADTPCSHQASPKLLEEKNTSSFHQLIKISQPSPDCLEQQDRG